MPLQWASRQPWGTTHAGRAQCRSSCAVKWLPFGFGYPQAWPPNWACGLYPLVSIGVKEVAYPTQQQQKQRLA